MKTVSIDSEKISSQPGIHLSNPAIKYIHKHEWAILRFALLAADLILSAFAFQLAYWTRFYLPVTFFDPVDPSPFQYTILLLALVLIWIVIFLLSGLYDKKNLLSGTREYSLVFNAITLGVFFLIIIDFLSGRNIFARGWLVITWILALAFVGIERFAFRRLIRNFRAAGFFVSPTILVGANQEGQLLAEQLRKSKYSGLSIIGFIDDQLPQGASVLHNLKILGDLNNLDEVIQKYHVRDMVIASSSIPRDKILMIYDRYGQSNDLNLRMSSGLFEILTTGLQVHEFACVPLIGVNKLRLTGMDRIIKATSDYILASLGLLFTFPLFLLIAILIKFDSPGPIFYRRRVMGANHKQFDAYKFRTMYVNGQEILDHHPDLKERLSQNFKLKDDPRITRVGKWLRKTSLDEIPQVFNILLNQMSLVGPRMISPEELVEFKQWKMNLLTVKPGLTGLWQVSGRSDLTYEDRVRLDMYYIRNWTIWLDVQLIVRTVPAILSRRGAY